MKFRKKPIEIEAVRWTGQNLAEVERHFSDFTNWGLTPHGNLEIGTLEGVLAATPGDWIIRGVAGEFYPCKPEIFKKSYEPAEPHTTEET